MAYIKARPTIYAGVQMRSRLEAEFARWLDGKDVPWDYEPNCYADASGQYLPDFVILNHRFYEVKPQSHEDVSGTLAGMHPVLATVPDASLSVVIPQGEWDNGYIGWREVKSCSVQDPCGQCSRRVQELPLGAAFAENGFDYPNRTHLGCPFCWHLSTHLESVRQYQGGTDGIRLCVTLEFSCEGCGAHYALDFTNHKGDTLAGYTLR